MKQVLSIIMDICIFACGALCIYLLYVHTSHDIYFYVTLAIIILIMLMVLIHEILAWTTPGKYKKTKQTKITDISTLILLGEHDRPIKVWDLTGKIGLLIGKGTNEHMVDVDLADTDYHVYIDPEHALLNYVESGWWVQNVSVRNEISILRKGTELLLGNHAMDRLQKGDVLKIAHYTRIAVN